MDFVWLRLHCTGANPTQHTFNKKIHRMGVFLIKSGCGEWIWTTDLQVMSLTSYRTALPRDKVSVLYTIYDNSQIKNIIDGLGHAGVGWGLNYMIFVAMMPIN